MNTVTHVTTRQDMAEWTRAHADAPGIGWTVSAGPGGTMLITEPGRELSTEFGSALGINVEPGREAGL